MASLKRINPQHINKYQGYLIKRKKTFGFRKYAIILENDNITFYRNE